MELTPLSILLAVALFAQTCVVVWRGRRVTAALVRADRAHVDRRHLTTRESFDHLAIRELARGERLLRDVGLAVFDIDHLAQINDERGYAAGDAVVALAERELIAGVRRIDTVLALGGGSWALLLPDLEVGEIATRVESLRATLQRRLAADVAAGDDAAPATLATLSVGYCVAPHGRVAIADLFQAADQAALAAKLQGGNRGVGWGEAAREIVRRAAGRRRAQRDAQLATVLSLAEALDLRDADTSSHSQMVGFYAELMAQGLGMSPSHVERVRVAGLLHDIGKIGVPDSVLRKPAKLDDEEWAQMQQHPEIGARLLASIDAEDIRSWVLAHHERPDGRGYPHGLIDTEIPIEAKILSVADAYEAMTADRVYRKAPGPEIARSELDKWRGAQFDSQVVDAFLEVLDSLGQGGSIVDDADLEAAA